MSEVLAGPFAVAAIVLAVAGVAKLRAPAGAERGLAELGVTRASRTVVRVLAAAEVALATVALAQPGRVAAALLAALYAAFAGVSALLARRRAACGCFGAGDTPASAVQSACSAMLALIALAAVLWPPHGILDRSPAVAAILVIGSAGAALATVVVYIELPRAWGSWQRR
jgi:hypothetical protein